MALIDKKQFLFNKISDQLIINHLDKKIKMDVVQPDEIGQKFKTALEKEGSLKDIKGADWIVRFAEKIEQAAPVQDEQPADNNQEEKPVEENPEDQKQEEPKQEETPEDNKQEEKPEDDGEESDAQEDAEENDTDSEEDKKKKAEVNESVKIQDLTKSMVMKPKAAKTAKTPAAPKAKKEVKETEKKAPAKKPVEKKSEKKEEKPVEKKGEVEEAETAATGDELKVRVQKAVAKVFDIDKDEVDLVDVPNCVEGYNVYYWKLMFKDHEGQDENSKEAK